MKNVIAISITISLRFETLVSLYLLRWRCFVSCAGGQLGVFSAVVDHKRQIRRRHNFSVVRVASFKMVSTLLIFAICFVQGLSLPQPEIPQQMMPQEAMPQLLIPLPSLPFTMMQQPFPKKGMCPFNIGSVIEHSAKCGSMVHVGVGAYLGEDVKIANSVEIGVGTRISNGVTIGNKTTIGPATKILDGSIIGSNVKIGPGSEIGSKVTIDSNTEIFPGNNIANGVKIGTNSKVMNGVQIGPGKATFRKIFNRSEYLDVYRFYL